MSDSATPWTIFLQASLSMGFSRQEYWNVVPFPNLLQKIFPIQGSNLGLQYCRLVLYFLSHCNLKSSIMFILNSSLKQDQQLTLTRNLEATIDPSHLSSKTVSLHRYRFLSIFLVFPLLASPATAFLWEGDGTRKKWEVVALPLHPLPPQSLLIWLIKLSSPSVALSARRRHTTCLEDFWELHNQTSDLFMYVVWKTILHTMIHTIRSFGMVQGTPPSKYGTLASWMS